MASHLAAIAPPAFREGLVVVQRPLSLNPYIGSDDPAVRDVGQLLYRSLLTLDSRAYPRPDLATSYSVSPQGTTVRLVLAAGNHWSDGRSITPADVVTTLAFAASKHATNHVIAAALQGVKVASQGSVIVFTLAAPRASFVSMLTQMPILPLGALTTAQLAHLAAQPSTPLATSGPFTVQSADAGAVLLAANPHAHVKPSLSSFQFVLYGTFDEAAAAFASGNVDAVLATTPAQRARLAGVRGARAYSIMSFGFVDLLFNERNAALADPVVRGAFSTAIDRSGVIHGALEGAGGTMQVDAISEGLAWIATPHPAEVASQTGAAQALAVDGWGVGSSGVRVKNGIALAFTIAVPNIDPLPRVAAELAQQLEPVGIAIVVDVVPPVQFIDDTLTPRRFELALAAWEPPPDPDVSTFWRSNAVPPQGANVSGGPVDPFLDQALDTLATANDPQTRILAARNVNRYLAQDLPAIFLYTPNVAYVVRKPLIGLAIPAVGGSAARFDTVASWRAS